MANKDPFYRRLNALGFLLSLGSLIFLVISFQANADLTSPFSSLIRLILLSGSVVFFIALVHNPATSGQRFYALINSLVILAGIAISTRHIWLMHKPAGDTESLLQQCQVPFEQLMLTQHNVIDKLSLLSQLATHCSAQPLPHLPFDLAGQTLLILIPLLLICWKVIGYKPRSQGLFL